MEAQLCRSGSQCPDSAPCCRSYRTGISLPPSEGMDLPMEAQIGICSSRLARETESCGPSCACAPGLECYRLRTGMCCAPFSCYNATWVKEMEAYWRRCHRDPACRLPM
ncbi:uncharacterized protein LOC133174950 [Saccostrea echinata]|uniref:uncharacterized protein LOC133174950 n=1 Tax=Saccostrea echinata TaxID=191078 RepID=UPI002A81B5D5|nr:uncharacterized protein LOC133174950 [Saccostrea echinata]